MEIRGSIRPDSKQNSEVEILLKCMPLQSLKGSENAYSDSNAEVISYAARKKLWKLFLPA